MGWYAAATVQVGDHVCLPNTHPFEQSEVVGRTELEGGKLEFRTRVRKNDMKNINREGLRPEGVEDTFILAPGDKMNATLQRQVRSREFHVKVIDTRTRTMQVRAPDEVSAEDAAYWRLSSERETGDARITGDTSNRRYEVLD